jgi:hypothetical protein
LNISKQVTSFASLVPGYQAKYNTILEAWLMKRSEIAGGPTRFLEIGQTWKFGLM